MTAKPTAEAKLSGLQRNILLSIHELWDDRGETFGNSCETWGVPIGDNPEGYTPSQRAAYSRALKRLEARGLILRQNIMGAGPRSSRGIRRSATEPHDRTTHLTLTTEGVETAKRLTK